MMDSGGSGSGCGVVVVGGMVMKVVLIVRNYDSWVGSGYSNVNDNYEAIVGWLCSLMDVHVMMTMK